MARLLGTSTRFSRPARRAVMAAVVTAGLVGALALAPSSSQAVTKHPVKKPTKVLIVLFDQMRPEYADRFNMTNFKALRGDGTNFKNAQLGYMGSETVISHNVIVSGQFPKNMGWTDEVYRDTNNLLLAGNNAVHITGDLSMANFNTLIADRGYPKLANYLHTKTPGSKFIAVGEKSYAVESAAAGTDNANDIAVRLGSRKAPVSATVLTGCSNLNGSWRGPAGFNVPSYLTQVDPVDPTLCGRYYINSDKANDYGTLAAFPSWIYQEDGNRFFPGSDASAAAGHLGGDVWAADAAMEMMEKENWSGMFVTLGGIDKAGHMWGADQDTTGHDCSVGTGQVHVDCAAKIADDQLGRMVDKLDDLGILDDTLIVLTADHGATHGANYYGKTDLAASDSNWYWAPDGVYDGGAFTDTTYTTNPSPALLPLNATNNLQMSYQSTSIQAWLYGRSLPELKASAAVMRSLPGVIASYYRVGDHYVLANKNAMTLAEYKWFKGNAQRIVNTMAGDDGPDVVGLLHDNTSYGAYGDHGGFNEEVQRVPMVFWQDGLRSNNSSANFRTTDVLPTILKAMGAPLTHPVDGVARTLGR